MACRSSETWFRGPSDPLSNLYRADLFVFGAWYRSSEQAYQHQKAIFHRNMYLGHCIMQEQNTWQVMRLGRQVQTCPSWDEAKINIMFTILKAKLYYCPQYRQRLMATSHSMLYEDTPNKFWGSRGGRNQLGQLHMRVRSILG